MESKRETVLLLLITVIASGLLWTLEIHHPAFDYTHAWVSAHHATMARAFTDSGLLHLHGVPVENNLPLTSQPDFYVDWPPLFDIVLAAITPLVGDAPSHLQAAIVLLQTAIAFLLGKAIARSFGLIPGVICSVAFLLEPIVLKYGFGLFHVYLAMGFGLIGLLNWIAWTEDHRPRDLWFSAVFLGLAVLTSWEPVLLAIGVTACVLMDKDRKRLLPGLVAVGAAAGAAMAVVALVYVTEVPWAAAQLVAKARQQTGHAGFALWPDFRPHAIKELDTQNPAAIPLSEILATFFHRARMVGDPGLLALVVAAAAAVLRRSDRRYKRAFLLFLPLLGVWLGWAVMMWKHFYIHEYQYWIAAAPVAVALGITSAFLLDTLPAVGMTAFRPAADYGIAAVLLLAILAGALPTFHSTLRNRSAADEVAIGRFIARTTPAGALVLTREFSMVPMYYSNRHLIQGVVDAGAVVGHWDGFRALCDDCPIFLEFPERQRADYGKLIDGRTPVAAEKGNVIYRLDQPFPPSP